WTATPTISGLITATSGLTANGAVTVNSTYAQTATNATGTSASFTNTSLTTGKLSSFTSTNNSAANTAWRSNLFSPTNAQGTTAVSTGSIVGVDVQFTQNTSIAGNN